MVSRQIVFQYCLSEIPEEAELKRCALRVRSDPAGTSQFEPDISENIINVTDPGNERQNLDLFRDYVNKIRESAGNDRAKGFINGWINQYIINDKNEIVPAFKLGQECVFYEEDPTTKRLTCLGLKYPDISMPRPKPNHRLFLYPRAFPFRVKMGTTAAAINADPGVVITLPARYNITQSDLFKLLPPFASKLEKSTRIGKFVSVTISYPNPESAADPPKPPVFSMTTTAKFSSDPQDSSFEWLFGDGDSLVKKSVPSLPTLVRDYSNSITGTELPILRVGLVEECDNPTSPPESESESSNSKIVIAIIISVVAVFIFFGILLFNKLRKG